MKKHLFGILSIIVYTVLLGTISCFGEDEGDEWECLFCHQYPGLVIPEEPVGFKVISIDKEKHFSSPHGYIGCIKCHKLVKKVPHAGVTTVECTNGCHSEDKEKIEAMDLDSYIVHKDEQCSITSLKDESSCMICHSFYPHSKNLKVRAILNMHTGYMVCDLCHLKKENQQGLTYDWKSPDNAEFTGRPYGRYREINSDQETGSWLSRTLRMLSFGEKVPEKTEKAGYLLSRIAVFSLEGGEKKLLMNTWDVNQVNAFQNREKSLTSEEKKKELNYFHKDILKKEFSVACNECHSSRGVLDFDKLGYDDKIARYLKELDVKRLETEYEIFYFPHMLKR